MGYVLNEELSRVIAEELGCGLEDIQVIDEKYLEVCGEEYYILDNESADSMVYDIIKNSLWTFNVSFLARMTDMHESIYTALTDQCENGNEAIYRLVENSCGIDKFVKTAVDYDGRGNFISNADGREVEIYLGDEIYYLYKLG